LCNTIILFSLNSHILSWYHEIELDLDFLRFRLVEQCFARRPLSSLPSSATHVSPSPLHRAARARRLFSCPGGNMSGPPSPTDTEAGALDAAVAAAAPPSDGQPQQLAIRMVPDMDHASTTDRQVVYEVALARLAKAEEEVANASKARDAAVARAKRERVHTTAAAAALRPSTPTDSSAGGSASSAGGPADLHSALLLQEVAALFNLHAQAVAVNNIRSLVHIVLDVNSNHFNRWRNQFLLVLGKFSLQAHVLAAPAPSPDWDRMDCVVKAWILDSLTDDLAEIVSSQGATARDAWLAVESQFLGNLETRAIQLETKFRNFIQGDLSVTEYCRRLKKMADDLTALGEAVTDRTLVLTFFVASTSASRTSVLYYGAPAPSPPSCR
jgi:hypothetical protein